MAFKRKSKTETGAQDSFPTRKSRANDGSGRLLNCLAFYTFVVAAAVLLVRAILAFYLPSISHTLDIIATVVQIILYAIAGILAYRFVRKGRPMRKMLFFLAAFVLIAAAVLPLVFR